MMEGKVTQTVSNPMALVVAIVIGLMVASCGLVFASESDDIQPRHWRVIWKKNPATQAMVAWNTKTEGKVHQLRWREKGAKEYQSVAATSGQFSYGDKKKDENDVPYALYYHQVDLEGLKPYTTYEVEFVSDTATSRMFYFVTAPAGDTPLSLLYGGDSRTKREPRREINGFMARLVHESEAAEDPADRIVGVMHGGDFAQVGTDIVMWNNWMEDHEHLVTKSGRLVPMIPARGNHDRGRLFNECFGFKNDDTRNWYAVSFGSLLRVVTLNTETSIAGDQARWLKKELAASVPNHSWVVPQYHRPGYSAVKIPGGALAHWVPIFEEFNLKLVCEADGHVIKRTLPIRKGKHDETGVVYIGEGGFGVEQRTPKEKRWFLQSPGMCSSGNHVQRLKFTTDRLTYECLSPDDGKIKVVDQWETPAVKAANATAAN